MKQGISPIFAAFFLRSKRAKQNIVLGADTLERNLKMIRLSDITEDAEFKPESHARYPGAHCAFFGVAGMVPLIKNSSALMVGPSVCLYNAKLNINMRRLTSDPRPDNLLLLLLDHHDTIFGAHEKIQKAVIEADKRFSPEILFVTTTCTQEIIGEDFDAAVDEIRPQVRAKVLVVHTDNFTCEDASPGLERTYLALAEIMEPGETEKNSVNLLGLRSPGGRKTETVRLLESKGVRVNIVLPSYSTPREIAQAPRASLNIVMEHQALPLAEKMKEDFGVPYLYGERPYTPDALEAWHQRLAGALQINLDSEIRDLKKSALASIKEKRGDYSGKSFIMGLQQGRSFDLARLFVLLGMEPLVLYANRILPHDMGDIRSLLACGVNPLVLKSGDARQSDDLLAQLRPDYHIGHGDRKTLARLGIQSRSLMRAMDAPGFAGVQRILRLLDRPLAGSNILEFKEQYIRDGGGLKS